MLVTSLDGSVFPFFACDGMESSQLTHLLAERCGIPPEVFRLKFRGRYLTSALKNLERDESLRMVLKAPLLGGGVLKSGFLTKEPISHRHPFSQSRRRFLVLSDRKLEWFVDEESTKKPKGSMLLDTGCQIERSPDSLTIISTATADRLVLHGEGLDDWEEALQGRLENLESTALQRVGPGETNDVDQCLDEERLILVLQNEDIRLLRPAWLCSQPETFA